MADHHPAGVLVDIYNNNVDTRFERFTHSGEGAAERTLDPAELPRVDGLNRFPVAVAPPKFDLNANENVSLSDQQVDFAARVTIISTDDAVAAKLQKRFSDPLTECAHSPVARHRHLPSPRPPY
jgi:hypothetical protein